MENTSAFNLLFTHIPQESSKSEKFLWQVLSSHPHSQNFELFYKVRIGLE